MGWDDQNANESFPASYLEVSQSAITIPKGGINSEYIYYNSDAKNVNISFTGNIRAALATPGVVRVTRNSPNDSGTGTVTLTTANIIKVVRVSI